MPFWKRKNNDEGNVHKYTDNNVKAGPGRPDDNADFETVGRNYGGATTGGTSYGTYSEPPGANDLRDEIRLRNLERQYAHFGNPPGYDPQWAQKEGFTDWDDHWAKQAARNILKVLPDITHEEASLLPGNLKDKDHAYRTLDYLNGMIDERDEGE